MKVGIKDSVKLFILSVMSCCAVFVCNLFLNFQCDLMAVENQIDSEVAQKVFEAMKSSSVMVCCTCGGGLLATSVVMMIFYVKNYIDVHKKELGILKALGYPRMKIAVGFWPFGLSVLIGTVLGYIASFVLMPSFYEVRNDDAAGSLPEIPGLTFPEVELSFHLHLLLLIVILPAVLFGALAVIYAFFKLKTPVLLLIKDNYEGKRRDKHIKSKEEMSFVETLKSATVKSRKTLVFFVIFGSFCFSGMTQLSFGVKDFADEMMSYILLVVGLVLAFVTLFLAITTVVKANTKTIAMMKVFGYPQNICRSSILGGYRPLSYIGFAIGTAYQYFLIQLIIKLVFADFDEVPEYEFSVPIMLLSLAVFVIVYEGLMLFYSEKLKQVSLKEIMLE